MSSDRRADKGAGDFWDGYVERWKAEHQNGHPYPGFEWGDQDLWVDVVEKLFLANLRGPKRFVEIGSGAGKLTYLVSGAFPGSHFKCFDISQAFLDELKSRLPVWMQQDGADRVVEPILLDPDDPKLMQNHLEKAGWAGQVDCVFSIDAFVHINFQIAMAYLLTAAKTLRVGGWLILSVADVSTPAGFQKAVLDITEHFAGGGAPSSQFQWTAPDMWRVVLTRLGFQSIKPLYLKTNSRDMYLCAQLTNPCDVNW